jgi:hypothetical protein
VARHDLDDRRETRDHHGPSRSLRLAVAELPALTVAPAADRSVVEDRARVRAPGATAMTRGSGTNGPGASTSPVVPSPVWPEALYPKHWSRPLVCRIQLCVLPSATRAKEPPAGGTISNGPLRCAFLPSPI